MSEVEAGQVWELGIDGHSSLYLVYHVECDKAHIFNLEHGWCGHELLIMFANGQGSLFTWKRIT